MSTNITGLAADRPLVDPAIAVDEDFLLGGHLVTSGGGSWNESAEIYFEWDQGTATWVSLSSTGALNIAAQGNPTAVLQDANEHQVTVYSDGTAGSFQVRLKAIEDDTTEYTTTAVDVTVTGVEDIAIGTGGTLYEEVGVDAELGATVSLPDPLIISVYDEVDADAELGVTVAVQDKLSFEIDVYDEVGLEESVVRHFENIIVSVYDEVTADEGWDEGLITELPDPLVISVYDECSLIEDETVTVAEAEPTGPEINVFELIEVWSRLKLKRIKKVHDSGTYDGYAYGNRNARHELSIAAVGFTPDSIRVQMGATGVGCTYEEVTVALQDAGSLYDTGPPDTTTPILFSGSRGISVPQDTNVWSDEIPFPYEITGNLLAHVYVGTIYNCASYSVSGITPWFHLTRFTSDADVADISGFSYNSTAATDTVYGIVAVEAITDSETIFWSQVTKFIQEYDAVALVDVAEDVTVAVSTKSVNIDIYDEVSIEDAPTMFFEIRFVSVYDEVELIEDIAFGFDSSVDIYDEVSITEYNPFEVGAKEPYLIDLYDEVSIDEAHTSNIVCLVSLYDEVGLEEDVSSELPDPLLISTYEDVSVVEAEYTPQVAGVGDLDLSLFDSVGIDELVTSSLPDALIVDVNSGIVVVDKTPVYQLLYDTKVAVGVVTGISVYDEVNLTESITIEQLREINVYDEVDIAEDHEETVYLSGGTTLEVDVYDSVGIAEDITFEFISYISVVDEVTVVESTELAFESIVSVYDSVAVTEDYSVTFDLTIDVYDEVTVADIVTISADIDISISDEVSITEDIERSEISYVFVYDDISLAEDVTSYKYTGIYTVSVYDSVSTLEDIDLLCYQGVYLVSVYDEVSTDENVTVSTALAGINIEDSVGVADVPVVELGTATLIISINDEINLGEDAQAGLSDLSPSVSDSIVVSEYLNVPAFYSLIVGSVLIIEDVVLILPEFNVTTKPTQMLTLFQNTEFKTGLIVPKMTTDVILPSIEVELL